MRNLHDIRRDNLRLLIDTRYRGVLARLAEALGRQPAYISRLFMTNAVNARNIGEKMAREIEQAAGLDEGWMDRPHNQPATDTVTRMITEAGGTASAQLGSSEQYQRTIRAAHLVQLVSELTPDRLAKVKAALMIADVPDDVIDAIPEKIPNGFMGDLSPDERQLLDLWRNTSAEGRKMIMQTGKAAQTRFPLLQNSSGQENDRYPAPPFPDKAGDPDGTPL